MGYSSLIMGPERRRRWSEAAKRAVLEAAFAPAILLNEPVPATLRPEPAIVAGWVGGARGSINADASPGLVAATLQALRWSQSPRMGRVWIAAGRRT